jgi:hypothetical protein
MRTTRKGKNGRRRDGAKRRWSAEGETERKEDGVRIEWGTRSDERVAAAVTL